jgi:hypothetical protein
MITQNHRQEGLARAYVQAIAAQAGVLCSRPDLDYGIDLSLRAVEIGKRRHYDSSVQIDLQLKSTTRAAMADADVSYDLDAAAYNDLCAPQPACPRLLVLLVLPKDEQDWVSQSAEELLLRRCAYWRSLRGSPVTTATRSVRVAIPLANVFSAAAVRALLHQAREGKGP